MNHFRHKALAALMASLAGALGLQSAVSGPVAYGGSRSGVTLIALPLIIGVENWYQTSGILCLDGAGGRRLHPGAFYRADAGRALRRSFQPNAGPDATAAAGMRCWSRWLRLFVGAVVLMTTIALLTQTYFEYALKAAPLNQNRSSCGVATRGALKSRFAAAEFRGRDRTSPRLLQSADESTLPMCPRRSFAFRNCES